MLKGSPLFQVIDASDVVIEVLDARDPLGCRCPQLEEAVLQRGGTKKLLLVLNKIGKLTWDPASCFTSSLNPDVFA